MYDNISFSRTSARSLGSTRLGSLTLLCTRRPPPPPALCTARPRSLLKICAPERALELFSAARLVNCLLIMRLDVPAFFCAASRERLLRPDYLSFFLSFVFHFSPFFSIFSHYSSRLQRLSSVILGPETGSKTGHSLECRVVPLIRR